MLWIVFQKPDKSLGASQPHDLRILTGQEDLIGYDPKGNVQLGRIVARFHGEELRMLVDRGDLLSASLVEAPTRYRAIQHFKSALVHPGALGEEQHD